MKEVWQTRFIFWKKQWKSLIFWSLFPLIMTSTIIIVADSIQDETKVPVGIVLEDDSSIAKQLYESIERTSYVRPFLLEKRDALNKIEKHELDSVFIIQKNYEDSVERNRRNNLVKSYQSDLSFAYIPLKELVVSYVYEDFTRSHAAFVVRDLYEKHNINKPFVWTDLIEQSKTIEQEQDLLQTTLTFAGEADTGQADYSFVDPWTVWVLTTLLATFLIFDWVIKENNTSLLTRFSFSKYTFKQYLIMNGFIYTVLLFLFDVLTILLLSNFFQVPLSFTLFISMFSYRVMINILVFLFSLLFKSIYSFYMISFVLFCLNILGSGVLIPLDGLIGRFPLFIYLNPLQSILSIQMMNYWFIIACLFLVIWFMRKERRHA